jgi:DNA-binding MarR family transcriptional regulator
MSRGTERQAPGGFAGRSYVSGMLSRTTRSISVGLGRRLSSLDLGFGEYLVLVRLWRAAPAAIAQADLVIDLAVERSSMSTLLASLEGAGLVQRAPDPTDRRRLLVALTEHGHALELPVLQIVDDYESELLKTLPSDELSVLRDALDRLQDRAMALRVLAAAPEETGSGAPGRAGP